MGFYESSFIEKKNKNKKWKKSYSDRCDSDMSQILLYSIMVMKQVVCVVSHVVLDLGVTLVSQPDPTWHYSDLKSTTCKQNDLK